jgi:hypothetical protein
MHADADAETQDLEQILDRRKKKTDQLRLYTEAGFFGILNHPSTHAIYSTQEVAH